MAGRGAVPQTKGWVYLLYESGAMGDVENVSLTNGGANGGVTSQVVLDHQVPLAVGTVRPDVVTIMVGFNDLALVLAAPDPFSALPGILGNFRRNLTNIMLTICAGLPNARVYIANAYELPAAERQFPGVNMAIGLLNVQIADVANRFDVPVADLHQAFQGGVGLWEGELAGAPWSSAHPTKKGHRVVAHVFADLVRSRDGRMTCPAL